MSLKNYLFIRLSTFKLQFIWGQRLKKSFYESILAFLLKRNFKFDRRKNILFIKIKRKKNELIEVNFVYVF